MRKMSRSRNRKSKSRRSVAAAAAAVRARNRKIKSWLFTNSKKSSNTVLLPNANCHLVEMTRLQIKSLEFKRPNCALGIDETFATFAQTNAHNNRKVGPLLFHCLGENVLKKQCNFYSICSVQTTNHVGLFNVF